MDTSPQLEALAALAKPFRDDFLYYAPRCLKIRTKAGEIKPFELNYAQTYLHGRLEAQKRNKGKVRALVPKMRQGGISTYIEGRFYHRTSLFPGQRAYILTHLQEATDNLFAMTRRYHDNCPFPFKPSTRNENANELRFDQLDSEFSVATAGSSGTGRSATAQLFHGSEIAFWKNAKDHMAGIGQIIPNEPGTEIVLESTGNGEGGNMFYQMVMDAMKGRGEYIVVFIPWFWDKAYTKALPADFVMEGDEAEYAEQYRLTPEQIYWRRMKIIDDFRGDTALFAQEYPAELLDCFRRQAVESYITRALIERARRTVVNPDDIRNAPRIMGVDVAEYGDDDTAIAKRQGRVILPVKRKHGLSTMEVVGVVAKEADEWNPDAINVDCTGIGSGVADRLLELGYPVNRVHFGENAIDHDTYDKRTDEMYGEFKRYLEDMPCQMPDDDVLQAEFTSRGYTYDSSRRLKMESKEHMRGPSRGLPSPDSADAVVLTFATPISPNGVDPAWQNRRNARRARAARA